MTQYRTLFRNRNFLLLWLGGAISNIGDFFNALALVKILSADEAHLGLWMALVMMAKMVPGVLLGPVAGVLADRISRKRIMIISDAVRVVLVLGLVITRNPGGIVALVFLAACAAAFFNPAAGALLPGVVAPDELVTAGSLSVMTQRSAQLIGNGLGALVLMALGPHNVFYIDAVSFFVSALFTGMMVLPATAAAEAKTTASAPGLSAAAKLRQDLRDALTCLFQVPAIRRLFTALGIATVGDSALSILLITFFTVELGLPSERLGFVWAVFGGTSIVGALAIGALGNRIHWRRLISAGAIYVWVMTVGALLAHGVIPTTLFFGLMGLGSGAINVGLQAAIGQIVPDQMRGRVLGAAGMCGNLIMMAGASSAGALSDAFGAGRVLLGYTLTYLMTGVYTFFAFRNLEGDQAVADASAESAAL